MGPRADVVLQIQSMGFSGFLTQQMQVPTFQYAPPIACARTWVQDAAWGNDNLRLKTAYALSSIFVTSANDSSYLDYAGFETTVANDAFGNFRTLMTDVTLNPSMGSFLNMAGNWTATDPSVHPNQNYARELMQLFTVGPNLLNDDGSIQTDSIGNPLLTYSENDVLELSRALTGWNFAPTVNPLWVDLGVDWSQPMVSFDQFHDHGSKTIIGNTALPAGNTAPQDLNAALDAIFNHPNVPPFISQRLIQQFVTSNPSPAYVERIAHIFENDGNGVRGNLAAVISGILLDPEARAADNNASSPNDGILQDPIKHFLSALNALQSAPSDDEFLWGHAVPSENIFQVPSVFGFFPYNYVMPGTTVVSPAAQVFDDNTSNGMSNLDYGIAMGQSTPSWYGANVWIMQNFHTVPDFVDAENHLFFGGKLDPAQEALIVADVTSHTELNLQQQFQRAAFLAIDSTSFGVTH